MTTETKTMIIVIVASILILFGGAWLYQKSSGPGPSNILTENKEALVREDSMKLAASSTEKLVVVEFADYQCPACSYIAPGVKELMRVYGENVTFVFRDFPLTLIHRNAMSSAQMTRIAGEQGKYWEMHEILFEKQSEWENLKDPSDVFVSYAAAISMDTSSIKEKLSSGAYVDKIKADLADGELLGVAGTPTFFVGDKIIRSADFNALKKAIEDSQIEMQQ